MSKIVIRLIFTTLITFVGCADLSPDTFMEVHGQFIKSETVIEDLRSSMDSTAFPLDEKDLYHFVTKQYVPSLLFRVAGYEMGLAQTPAIQQQIQAYIPELMIGQTGLLYEMLIPQEIPVTDEDLTTRYRQSQFKLRLAYLKVHSLPLADSLYQSISNNTKFEKIAAGYYYFHQPQQTYTINDIHPEIFITAVNLRPGNVASPLQLSDGYYIIKLLEKERFPLQPLEAMESEIIDLDKTIKRTRFIENYQLDLLAQLDTLYNSTAVTDLYRRWQQQTGKSKPNDFVPGDLILLSLDTLKIRATDVVEHYRSLPAEKRFPIKSPDDIHQLIKEIALPHLLLHDAFQRGLAYHPYYTQAIKAYRDSLVESLYFQKFIQPQIVVNEDRVLEIYNKNAESYAKVPKDKALAEIRQKLRAEATQKAIQNEVNKLSKYYIIRQNILAVKKVLTAVNQNSAAVAAIR
jgi:hypothetical protein